MARTHPAWRPVHMSYVLAETDRYNCTHMETCSLSLIWRHFVGVEGQEFFQSNSSDMGNIFILCHENNLQNIWIKRGLPEHLRLSLFSLLRWAESRVCVSAAQENKTLVFWCRRLWNVPEHVITESGVEPGSSRVQFCSLYQLLFPRVRQLCLFGNFYLIKLCNAAFPALSDVPAGCQTRPCLGPAAPLGHPARRFVCIFIKSASFVISNMCPSPRFTRRE